MEEQKLYYGEGTKLYYNGGRFYKYENMGYENDFHFHFYSKVITPLHAHDYFEFFITTQGSALHTFKGDTISLNKGTLCLVAPYEQHQFHQSDVAPIHFNVAIKASVFKELCDTLDPTAYNALLNGDRYYSMNQSEFEYFRYLSEMLLAGNEQRAKMLIKTITVNVITQLVSLSEGEDMRPEWFKSFCDKIKSSDYFLKPVSELYKLVPYSQPILNSTFKQYMNETLISYLTKMRINYAANLLSCSNYSIIEISEQTSYNSLSHFNHTFKKCTGYTPSEYRRIFGKKEPKS